MSDNLFIEDCLQNIIFNIIGRIVPCMLVGDGARKWANEHNIEEVNDDALKTESIIKSHRHYKQKLITFEKKNLKEKVKESIFSKEDSAEANVFVSKELKSDDETISLDTVGAIVIDKFSQLASAVSSGGILLKYPGRIGHSSMFGCGCFVHDNYENSESIDENGEKISIAVCK